MSRIPGRGMAKGLRQTLRTFFTKPVTVEYPSAKPEVDPRYRGSFTFSPEKCTACELCVRSCPNKVIEVKWDKGEGPKRRLTGYHMRPGTCLFCGLCAEACPTKALTMNPQYELAAYRKGETGQVAYQAPPAPPPAPPAPPALEPPAAPPAEGGETP
ncbi:MAG: NuoI/complex I 23 kDa subunit family protein [Chitinophagales bacterium]